MISFWTQHPVAVLAFLAIADLLLGFYIVKNLPILLKMNVKTSEMDVLKKLASSRASSSLFEVKMYLRSTNDRVALYALKIIVNQSGAFNMEMLQKVIFRSNNRKTLLVGCLKKIAEKNPKLIVDLFSMELPEWLYIACLKILVKVHSPDVVTLLVNAQENSSEAIQKCAKQLLEKMQPADPAKIAS